MSYIRAVEGCAAETGSDRFPAARRTYRSFHGYRPPAIVIASHGRTIPDVLVHLGALRGLVYAADRGDGGVRTYIHFMEQEPLLTCNAEGTQLYIVGGKYRVTRRGIEG